MRTGFAAIETWLSFLGGLGGFFCATAGSGAARARLAAPVTAMMVLFICLLPPCVLTALSPGEPRGWSRLEGFPAVSPDDSPGDLAAKAKLYAQKWRWYERNHLPWNRA